MMTSDRTVLAGIADLERASLRALQLLAGEKAIATTLAVAGFISGGLQVAEPLLFGRAVNALAQGQDSLPRAHD